MVHEMQVTHCYEGGLHMEPCLTVHGGRPIKGIHYWEPTLHWFYGLLSDLVTFGIDLWLAFRSYGICSSVHSSWSQTTTLHENSTRIFLNGSTMDMFSSSRRTFMEPKMLGELGMSIYAVCLSRNLVFPNPVLMNMCLLQWHYFLFFVDDAVSLCQNPTDVKLLKLNWSIALR